MNEASLLCQVQTPLAADVVLFHPRDERFIYVGTYSLDEVTRLRRGKILVYQIQRDEQFNTSTNLILLQEIDCDALLDFKWYNNKLYVAQSTGSIAIYSLDHYQLYLLHKQTLLDSNVLILSLSVDDKGVLASMSDGTLGSWTHDLQPVTCLQVSNLECWIQSHNPDSDALVYAGADDAVLSGWDVKSGEKVFANRKSHGAGVTAILPVVASHKLLTGSYDDKLREFDLRNPLKTLQDTDLGGGVWRLVPTTHLNSSACSVMDLLVCCMYNGAKVVRYKVDREFETVKTFQGHNSMCYGGDVSHGNKMVTCSFYDKRVCVWE